MFGHAAGPSRVYRYGCLPPLEGADIIEVQMRRAHRYRNVLVEIERTRRQKAREAIAQALGAHAPDVQAEVDAAAARVAEIEAACAKARMDGRTRRVPDDLRRDLQDARARLRRARAALREVRERIREDETLRRRLEVIDREADEAIRRARAESGLYWGTYLVVEQAARMMRRAKGVPRFRPWDGNGLLAVQFQGGLPVTALFSRDTRCWIDPTPQPIPGRRGKPQPRLYFRVGSNPDGTPVWAVLPIILHRPLPDGHVKWAYLVRKRIGTHYRWEAQFVIEFPETPVVETGAGAVAIDVGWRMINGRIRVAYWWDGEQGGELVLDERWVEGMRRVERIRAHRDRLFNEAKAALLEAYDPSWPEWIREEVATAAQWRSHGRLAALVWRWREHRFAGDETIYERMEAWRKRNRHLYEYEANLRDQLLARRLDIYRRFVAEIRRRYGVVYMERMDLRRLAHDDPAREPGTPEAQHWRQWAAVSQLRRCIEQSGLTVVRMRPHYTTLTCAWCGHIDPGWEPAASVEHTCSACGRTWDQDLNAARNLLAWGQPVQAAR